MRADGITQKPAGCFFPLENDAEFRVMNLILKDQGVSAAANNNRHFTMTPNIVSLQSTLGSVSYNYAIFAATVYQVVGNFQRGLGHIEAVVGKIKNRIFM